VVPQVGVAANEQRVGGCTGLGGAGRRHSPVSVR
jgi:hypothetical protein